MTKPLISIIAACYNEEGNVEELYRRIVAVMNGFAEYDFEIIFIDNASADDTVPILRRLAQEDHRLKIIVNMANFGHIRSGFHGFIQGHGDAVITLAADLQNPPELIQEFLEKWKSGYKIVAGVKTQSVENLIMRTVRTLFYKLMVWCSETRQIEHFTGFGLYDKDVMKIIRSYQDPYPYVRGIVSELGFDIATVEFVQPKRTRGLSKMTFYSLYDMAMTGFVNYSRVPLRMATFTGFGVALMSLFIAAFYFFYKLLYWNSFDVGMAPLVLGLFFFSSVQLIFLGILGEYVGAILTQVKNRPHVIEKERINFDKEPEAAS